MLWLIESLLGEVGSDFIEYAVQLLADSSGATAIEYGLIAALIAIAAVGAMSGLGAQISQTLNRTSTEMSKS
jgi:pilus assembly protein Flp/PilA